MSHGGGYPGYGSHVLLIPTKGLGVFALTNRTYGGPSGAVWDAAAVLTKAELFKDRVLPVSEDLARAYRAVGSIYKAGSVDSSKDQLAMNFLMDRDAAGWSRDLAKLKKAVGDCDTDRGHHRHRRHGGRFQMALRARPANRQRAARTDDAGELFSRSSSKFSRADSNPASRGDVSIMSA